MLRFSYLPSDFNPMLLVLGEADDFRQLAALLRIVGRGGGAIALETTSFSASGDTRVRVATDGGPPGLTVIDGAEKQLQWILDPATADISASVVAELADPARLAGSAIIDAQPSERGVAVKFSLGEFADNFLLRCPDLQIPAQPLPK
jgi:hypothetical protein